MQGHFLVTDDGPHPPEKWAEVTADHIIAISEQAEETKVVEAQRFREKLVDLLTRLHDSTQKNERGQLEAEGVGRLAAELDPGEEDLEGPAGEIIQLAAGFSFEDHFQKPETKEHLKNVLRSHHASQVFIERSWHADRNPDSPEAKEFHAKYHPGPEGGTTET
jgi:hypothetical protein